jgi:DNA-binding transcriptional MerR regulator
MLTTGQIRDLAGLDNTTIDRWADAGWVTPLNNQAGTGNHRIFSEMQAVALSLGQAYRAMGCGNQLVESVVRLVGNMALEHAEAEIEIGRRWVIPLPSGARLVSLPPARDDLLAETMSKLDLAVHLARVRERAT